MRIAAALPLVWLLLVPGRLGAQSAGDADALYKRAAGFYGSGSYDKAIPFLLQAAAIDEQLGASRRADLAYDRKYLGLCYANTGQSVKAREQLEQALPLFFALGEKGEQVEVQNRLGLLDYYRADYDAAERRFQAALDLARAAGLSRQVPDTLNNLGLLRYARGRYTESIELYRAAYDEHVKAGDEPAAAQSLGNIASVHLSLSHWPEAEEAYRRALASFERLGDRANAANTRINLGILHATQGSYDLARSELEDGLAQAAALGLRQSEAYGLGSLGSVYYATGRYDLAEQNYRRALQIDRSLDLQLNVVSVSTSLGRVYQAWGRNDQAMELYRTSLDAAQRLGVPDQVVAAMLLIGGVHAAQGRYDLAIEEYGQALTLAEQSGREAAKLPILDSLGSANFQLRFFEKAESFYRAALELAQRLGQQGMAGRELIHLGAVSQVSGNQQDALLMYRSAVQMCRAAGVKVDEATALNNLGTLFIDMRSWDQAEAQLLQAIAIKEQLRATASGQDRMDFLASQISSYRWLVTARVRRGDAAAAFDATELMKARWLSEQLGGDAGDAGFAGIRAFQGSLGARMLVLDFANVDADMPVLMSASRDAVRAWDLSLHASPPTGVPVSAAAAGEQPPARGFVIVRTAPKPAGFSDIVAEYRKLLALARPSQAERSERDRLAHELYAMLLGPAAQELEGKEELLVVPEGSLCALPFETLRMPDGRYLVERFHLTYMPSLTVKGQLERRRGVVGKARPLLAFGGALYGGAPSKAARSVSDQQLASLRLDATRLGEEHRSVSYMRRLGSMRGRTCPALSRKSRPSAGSCRVAPCSPARRHLSSASSGSRSPESSCAMGWSISPRMAWRCPRRPSSPRSCCR